MMFPASVQKQQGVALFVALILLVVISVLGIVAMRGSATNARITTSIQAGHLSFEAAQSAINASVKQLNNDVSRSSGLLWDLYDNKGEVKTFCVTGSGLQDNSCGGNRFLDARSLVSAESQVVMLEETLPAEGWSLTGGSTFGYSQVRVVGEGKVAAVGASAVNVQELVLLTPNMTDEL